MNDIYDLLDTRAEYLAKMEHRVPMAESISREQYLLGQAKGKVVLDVGASGPMSEAIRQIAGEYHSINRANAEWCIDLDTAQELPGIPGVEVVIAGEVIEHLSNAGHFLDLLHGYKCPLILTTPNAMNKSGYQYIQGGVEMVNPEHVAYYSWHTLKVLVERHGYGIVEWYWYNGEPGTAEGLIFNLTLPSKNDGTSPGPFPKREGEKEGVKDAEF